MTTTINDFKNFESRQCTFPNPNYIIVRFKVLSRAKKFIKRIPNLVSFTKILMLLIQNWHMVKLWIRNFKIFVKDIGNRF